MRLLHVLILSFILIPLLEIYLLVKVGGLIGAFNTVALVITTAILGGFLLRQQGVSTLMRVQGSLARGQVPAQEMMEGAVLLVGGVLLLTPGFFTDALGFLGLIPQVRQAFVRWMMRKAVVEVRRRHPHERPGQRTIEGDFQDLSDRDR